MEESGIKAFVARSRGFLLEITSRFWSTVVTLTSSSNNKLYRRIK